MEQGIVFAFPPPKLFSFNFQSIESGQINCTDRVSLLIAKTPLQLLMFFKMKFLLVKSNLRHVNKQLSSYGGYITINLLESRRLQTKILKIFALVKRKLVYPLSYPALNDIASCLLQPRECLLCNKRLATLQCLATFLSGKIIHFFIYIYSGSSRNKPSWTLGCRSVQQSPRGRKDLHQEGASHVYWTGSFWKNQLKKITDGTAFQPR